VIEGSSSDAQPKTETEAKTSINSLNHDEMANIASRLDNPDDLRRLRESSQLGKSAVGMEPIFRIADRLTRSLKHFDRFGRITYSDHLEDDREFINGLLAGEINLLRNDFDSYTKRFRQRDVLLSSDDSTIEFLGKHLHV
jgi:hypothetical protein